MRVSGLLITHQLSEEGERWFSRVIKVVDELVAFVDEERAAPGVHERLVKLGARIFNSRAPAFYNCDFGQMVAACQGDWVLKVDYDEELSTEWDDPRWREILEGDAPTHFWSPRRWLTTPGNFLDCEPWWPDWQLRLFRNQPSEITFPTELHDTMSMKGRGAYLRTLAIHHHDLRLASRRAREEKARAYERQRPGRSLGYFYLFDDHAPPQSPLPSGIDFAPEREILRMEALAPEEIQGLSLAATPPAPFRKAGELFWVDVEVTNNSGRALGCGAPFSINLAYHWLHGATRETIVFDGERTAILPELPSGKRAGWKMFVIAPGEPGDYLLQLTMVQERVRWLEAENPNLPLEFAITVAPKDP